MINPRTPSARHVAPQRLASRPDRAQKRASSAFSRLLIAVGLFVGVLASETPARAEPAVSAAARTCGGRRATVVGSSRSDTLHGTSRADVIWAGPGHDTVYGHGGNDTICGGDGRDKLIGGVGADRLLGGNHFDRLVGGVGTTDSCTAGELRSGCERIPSFATLAPGARLPSGRVCARNVDRRAEIRPANRPFNRRRGTNANQRFPRVGGGYTGTTDQILQWVACKWGVNERMVRAQAARESWWYQQAGGDLTNDQSDCHPRLRTSSGPCPESIGLLQVRYQYHLEAFEDANAILSSAYNADYAYASWRACYEGEYTWLNNVERGGTYRQGHAWGCFGVWFAGRWRTPPANQYIANVKDYYRRRVWATAGFRNSSTADATVAEAALPAASASNRSGIAHTASTAPTEAAATHHSTHADHASHGVGSVPTPEAVAAFPAAARPTCAGRVATKVGTAGNNRIVGTSRADVIVGGAGHDVIYGKGGNDVICAGSGFDTVLGGDGSDVIVGGYGNDFLYGMNGADRINGGPHNDVLVGGWGNDVLDGATGTDRYSGGPGRDALRRDRADSYFVENFDRRQSMGRFNWFVHNAANFHDRPSHWNGDHGDHCGAPTTYRDVYFPDRGTNPLTRLYRSRGELSWWCAPGGRGTGHMMTSFNTAGYGQVDFSPQRTFSHPTRVCWSQNQTNLGNRKWTQMVIVPEAIYQRHNRRLDYVVPRLEDGPGAAGLRLSNNIFVLEMVQGSTVTHVGRAEWANHDGFTTTDKARRYRTCVTDLENGYVRIALERQRSTETRVMRGAFPNGTVRVIFQDDNYNPTKAPSPVPYPFTWHWDDISVR